MGIKMAVAFAYIFMGKVVSQISNLSAKKPLAWKSMLTIWNINKDEVTQFIEHEEVSDTETTFRRDTSVY